MKNEEEKPLKELINKMLRSYGLGNKLDEISLVKSWESIVGKMIARHTTDIFFSKGTLHITLDSPPLREELTYAKSSLVEKLNEHAGKKLVKDIYLK